MVMVAVALVATATGCTPIGDPGLDTPSPSTTAAAAPISGSVSPTDLPPIPTLDDAEGAITAVTVDACTTETPLTAHGTVTNTTQDEKDFVVVVSWATDQGDVLARSVTTVENLADGDAQKWSADNATPVSDAVRCTITATSGTTTD